MPKQVLMGRFLDEYSYLNKSIQDMESSLIKLRGIVDKEESLRTAHLDERYPVRCLVMQLDSFKRRRETLSGIVVEMEESAYEFVPRI